jgi:hypothetical protein
MQNRHHKKDAKDTQVVKSDSVFLTSTSETNAPAWQETWLNNAKLISKILRDSNIDYAVYGSGASFLHGVPFSEKQKPGDIDITVSDVIKSAQVLKEAEAANLLTVEEISSRSALTVKKYKITPTGSNSFELDLTYVGEFGLSEAKKIIKDDISAISVLDTLLSLHLRIPPREKDRFAAVQLLMQYGEILKDSPEVLNHRTAGFTEFILKGLNFVEGLKEKDRANEFKLFSPKRENNSPAPETNVIKKEKTSADDQDPLPSSIISQDSEPSSKIKHG